MKTVSIDLAEKSLAAPHRQRSAADVASALVKAGYELIELKGLQQFHPKFRDGQPWDAVALPADSDAESLITAYDGLLRNFAAKKSFKHSVYLIDGAFEITGLVEPNLVRLRVGEYREPFLPASEIGVQITVEDYVSLWHKIAFALETAL